MKASSLSPATHLFGIRAKSTTRGKAICRFQVLEAHMNIFNRSHGGVLCALADETMGKAFLSTLPANQMGATVEMQIHFLRPAFKNDILKTVANVVSSGKTLSYVECKILGTDQRLIATASAILIRVAS